MADNLPEPRAQLRRPTGMKLAPVLAALLLVTATPPTVAVRRGPRPDHSPFPDLEPGHGKDPGGDGGGRHAQPGHGHGHRAPRAVPRPGRRVLPAAVPRPADRGLGLVRTTRRLRPWGDSVGLHAVTGTFDGTTITATDAVPGALYDPATSEELLPGGDPAPGPSTSGKSAQLAADPLRGPPGVCPAPDGRAVDVIHDDGSLQACVPTGVRRRMVSRRRSRAGRDTF